MTSPVHANMLRNARKDKAPRGPSPSYGADLKHLFRSPYAIIGGACPIEASTGLVDRLA